MSAKWCCWAGLCDPTTAGLSLNRDLLGKIDTAVVVCFPGNVWSFLEIESRRRRRGHPFQSGCAPRVWFGVLAVTHRPQEINHRQQVSNRQNRGAGGGEHIQDLEFWRILPVA